MKGKNKLVLVLFAIMALVATSVGFALKGTVDKIRYANAETIPGFTAKLEGDVIFSAERVYFAVNKNNPEDYSVRQKPIEYKGYNFNQIVTNNGVEYFGDYGLTSSHDYSNKKVVNNGDFVMANDNATYSMTSGETELSVKEGIMITLGGYYYATNAQNDIIEDRVGTNAQKWNGSDFVGLDESEEVGAEMTFVSAVQATLNGKPITLPNARDYHNASHEDFTWFIIPSEETEGHYQISFLYSMDDFAQPVRYEFEFYLLLQSSYDTKVEVNGNEYLTKPNMNISKSADSKEYEFYSGTSLNYPTLTFDYSRYDLSFTHNRGDETVEVDFEYDESTNSLNLSHKLYDDVEQEPPYIIDIAEADKSNTMVTLMFVEQGKYEFDFDYIYNKGEKVTIPQEQVPFENIKLNIYGYQLKYSKSGFTSADMTHLNVYKNGTMFILLNGFIDYNAKQTGSDLGVSYTLINASASKNYPTGTVVDGANQYKNSGSESAMCIVDADKTIVDVADSLSSAQDKIRKYQRTDRGLWLTLKDEYYLNSGTPNAPVQESFYYYNPSREIALTTNEAGAIIANEGTEYNKFTKVTTFTAPGYYLVQVKYKIVATEETKVCTQYFAFQITATTPMLELYKTKLETLSGNSGDLSGKVEDFYAREYTNQNVYAIWADTEIFESKVSGRLYYVKGQYAEESALKAVADGKFNSSVTGVKYDKNTIIKDSGAYLLVLEVEKSATRTYTYFKIDKDPISGLEVYGVSSHNIDNRAVYTIQKDSNLNYITYTDKAVIDSMFTLWWNDKASGAGVTATYKFTPFVKNNDANDKPISIESGKNSYYYVFNKYTIGSSSKQILIQKPTELNLSFGIDKVLIDQGIYEFNIIDQAGNELNYIVVVDRTENAINATYSEDKIHYNSGQLVADYVELEWGTHKVLNLGSVTADNDKLYKLINNKEIDNYYIDGKNNLSALYDTFVLHKGVTTTEDKNLIVIQNMYAEIKLDQKGHSYRITYNGNKQIQYDNGNTQVGWDEDGNYLFENASNYGIKVNVDKRDGGEGHKYVFEVKASNQVADTYSSKFTVRITPDEALGEVYSSSQEGSEYETRVDAKDRATKYFEDGNLDHDRYYEAQASNDGLFVFEWATPRDEFKVTEVKYNYYQLMDQDTLNAINKADIDSGKYPYYPYRYVDVANNYILKTDADGIEEISDYEAKNRTTFDEKGNVIESRAVYQSSPINLAYESYYVEKDGQQELVTQQVTQTGLYIITRAIVMKTDDGEYGSPMEYSYAFFVDRNMIIGYAINDVTSKIVGQFIHAAMPNSEASNGVKYDNFNKQGLNNRSLTYNTGKIVNDQSVTETIDYKVYLETNKLPTLIQVPSGKYVSGNIDDRTIWLTSYLNLELELSVYFKDTYNLLSAPYTGLSMQLMKGVKADKFGYIDLSFSNADDGIINAFKTARIHNNDNKLSLPGEYVFVIEDNVGHIVDQEGSFGEVTDSNQCIFGVKLINEAPETDVYTYAEMNGNKNSNVYADGKLLYTNQEFVDFIIPVEDMNAYKAQLDIANIEVWRSDIVGKPWFRLKSSSGGNGFEVDTTGYVQNLERVYWIDKDGNYINQEDDNARERLVAYVIKLDTGIQVDENNIITGYGEYTYTINIQYVLTNTSYTYYQYNQNGDKISFYQTAYTIVIDRSPNESNLNALMAEQGQYFEGYQTWLAEQNGDKIVGDINKKIAYRNTTAVTDYYGLANDLYYQYAKLVGKQSNQAMYALTVDYNSTFNPNELSELYYRELKVANEQAIEADRRMGLLPITDIYGGGYYHSFGENKTAYSSYPLANIDGFKVGDRIYYRAVMGANGEDESYEFNSGVFYEIVEKDRAGNLTQYVIYFAQPITEQSSRVSIKIDGDLIGGDNNTYDGFGFAENSKSEQYSFIGITDVRAINGLVGAGDDGDTSKNLYPYYGNINIYNASRDKIKTIYTNATSKHNTYNEDGVQSYGFEQEIYEVINNEGNYIIEYVDVFGAKLYLTINNYTTDTHSLNTAALKVQKDYSLNPLQPQYYINFSGLNTKLSENTYWYVDKIEISYDNKTVEYTANVPKDGKSELTEIVNVDGVKDVMLDSNERDRLNLAPNIQYMIKLTDVGGKPYYVPVSTTEGYFAYQLNVPSNVYARDNIYYTANEVEFIYNTDHYDSVIQIEEDGKLLENISIENGDYFEVNNEKIGYKSITLLPDMKVGLANHYGSLRVFKVYFILKESQENDGAEGDGQTLPQQATYTIYIDTRVTNFVIENTHKEDKIEHVKSTLKNGADGIYGDFDDSYWIADDFYYGNKMIVETVNISWTRLTSDYFTYSYQLLEFENKDTSNNLLAGLSVNEYPLSPKKDTNGKYIFKVDIHAKDGKWIATRVYGIYISTTITGLYEVKDSQGNKYSDYASITNLDEIYRDTASYFGGNNQLSTAHDLDFATVPEMETVFESFGWYTAIPMYIANTELTLYPSGENEVRSWASNVSNTSCSITFYRVRQTNYQTFVVIMYVKPETNKQILNTLAFSTTNEDEPENLLNSGTSKTVYNSKAQFYKLAFNSYNINTKANKLEQHNRIVIDVYYNNVFAKHVKGGDATSSTINFRNSGSYKLVIKDTAGNIQLFNGQDYFTLVVMKRNDMLYTINNQAPIQYAYYNGDVILQINRYNESTGKNNYDINTIKINVKRNSADYTGYEHRTESSEYTFKEPGTYLINMTANLLDTGEPVSSQLVFTIINPNEARHSLDFTSIYGYNIVSVFNITANDEQDVTESFISLLRDKSNVGDIDVYNKLVTYERAVRALEHTTQGKLKLRVLYEVENDDLLPSRSVEFTFTLNNGTATIVSSIAPGGKTTKPVTLELNPTNIYNSVGECNLVINGYVAMRINENSSKDSIKIQVTEIGEHYVQVVGDSGTVMYSFNFTIKQPLNTVSIILIVVVVAIAIALVGTFIWLRTRMKVR